MKTKIIATVAALAFAFTATTVLARNVQDSCANIKANPTAYAPADLRQCK
jgi:hypothetical protein